MEYPREFENQEYVKCDRCEEYFLEEFMVQTGPIEEEQDLCPNCADEMGV